MDHHPTFPLALIKTDRFHESLAQRGAVTGTLIIHVLAPQALRAMIAVTSPLQGKYVLAAVLTGKRFLSGDESHRLRVPIGHC